MSRENGRLKIHKAAVKKTDVSYRGMYLVREYDSPMKFRNVKAQSDTKTGSHRIFGIEPYWKKLFIWSSHRFTSAARPVEKVFVEYCFYLYDKGGKS